MDTKVSAIERWLVPLLAARETKQAPFVIGLSGVQGSGKSTIAKKLQESLVEQGYRTAQFSLDDLYLSAINQSKLTESGNTLWGSRGQFGTHDLILANSVFRDLLQNKPGQVDLPIYDKSRYQGRGDRAPVKDWPQVELPIDILIFEGWGIGFQPLNSSYFRHQVAQLRQDPGSQVAHHSDEDLSAVNNALREYCDAFMGPSHFDAMILLQAEQTRYVYHWRLQQEHALWELKGSGMSDEQVKRFVDRYYPSYELYLPEAIKGVFDGDKLGHQINLIMDENRKLVSVDIL